MRLRNTASVVILVLSSVSVTGQVLAQEKPNGDLIGSVSQYTVAAGDNLSDIARKNRVGLTELLAANPTVSSSTIHAGLTLKIPGQKIMPSGERKGTVVNLAALRLYHFKADGTVLSAPISVGREGWDTPIGETKVVKKRKDPTWTVPASIRKEDPKLPASIGPGPENPLGLYALNLGWPGILIHGTNKPSSVGKPSSHGCIRLYPEDIEVLYKTAPVGNAVSIIDTPVTLGQSQGALYLQVTPTREQATQIASFTEASPLSADDERIKMLKTQLATLAGKGAQINQQAVDAALQRHDGIPVEIGKISQLSSNAGTQKRVTPQAKSWWESAIASVQSTWKDFTTPAAK